MRITYSVSGSARKEISRLLTMMISRKPRAQIINFKKAKAALEKQKNAQQKTNIS